MGGQAEGLDRTSLLLPDGQDALIEAVAAAAAAAGKPPVILVIMSGGPVDVARWRDDVRVGAIVWCGYPGQEGGNAIADALFGTTNPSGKLTMTWRVAEPRPPLCASLSGGISLRSRECSCPFALDRNITRRSESAAQPSDWAPLSCSRATVWGGQVSGELHRGRRP